MKQKFTIEPAPMAGYTDLAFRKVLRKCGATVTWTEMISVTALFHNSTKTKNMLGVIARSSRRSNPAYKNTVVQLFGHNPAHFDAVIKSGALDNFHEININMGCPARKITSNGDGCALMKNPNVAREIIETCVRASKRSVSVKMRLGFAPNDRASDFFEESLRSHSEKESDVLSYAVEFAKMCESAGASRVVVHGRYGTQGYSGTADWNAIAEVVRALKIPVVANGDVKDAEHAKECIKQTGAAGVMICRALIGAPWVLLPRHASRATPSFRRGIINYHLAHADNILEMRKHLVAYANHLPNSKDLKKRLALVNSKEEVRRILQSD